MVNVTNKEGKPNFPSNPCGKGNGNGGGGRRGFN